MNTSFRRRWALITLTLVFASGCFGPGFSAKNFKQNLNSGSQHPPGSSPSSPSTYNGQHSVDAVHGSGYLEEVNGLPVLHVKGNYREMGYQYGYLMARELHRVMERIRDVEQQEVRRHVGDDIPIVYLPGWLIQMGRRLIGRLFYSQFPSTSKELIKGIVEGAKAKHPSIDIHRDDLALINSIVDLSGIVHGFGHDEEELWAKLLDVFGLELLVNNCDTMAVWGSRTYMGKTYQTRNTDIEIGTGVEEFPLVVVYKPNGRIPYISAGFVGMVGVTSGMNAHGVGLGQVWAFSKDQRFGTPWSLQMAEVLSQATSSDHAVQLFESMGKRTYGNNFLFADANGNGRVVEATPEQLAIFTANDPTEDQAVFNGERYSIPLPDAVFRGDIAMNPEIRARQYIHEQKDPRTASSYIERYKGQSDQILAYERQEVPISWQEAMKISQDTAMRGSSLQAAVYANTDRDTWFSYAEIKENGSIIEAYEKTYTNVPFYRYLMSVETASDNSAIIKIWAPTQEQEVDIRVHFAAGGVRHQRQFVQCDSVCETPVNLGPLNVGDRIEIVDHDGVVVDSQIVQ